MSEQGHIQQQHASAPCNRQAGTHRTIRQRGSAQTPAGMWQALLHAIPALSATRKRRNAEPIGLLRPPNAVAQETEKAGVLDVTVARRFDHGSKSSGSHTCMPGLDFSIHAVAANSEKADSGLMKTGIEHQLVYNPG